MQGAGTKERENVRLRILRGRGGGQSRHVRAAVVGTKTAGRGKRSAGKGKSGIRGGGAA